MGTPWTEIEVVTLPVAGNFDPVWRLLLETIVDWKFLRFHADGKWSFATFADHPCGPDGATDLSLERSQLILGDCAPACLIGRFGGSSANLGRAASADQAPGTTESEGESQPADPAAFAIGSDCLYKVPEGVYGPLFIGFNLIRRPIKIESLTLTVKGANF